MRVVYFMRSDVSKVVGGQGSGKIRRYIEYLREAGIDASAWGSDRDPPGRYDVGHVMNIDWPVEAARQMAAARRHCERVVFAPTHHREAWMAALNRAGRRGLAGRLSRSVSVERFESLRGVALATRAPRQLPEASRQLFRGVRARQREVLDVADHCVVLAQGEARSLQEDFGFRGPARLVPNSAEHELGNLPRGLPQDFLLCVGRIEARKNQSALLEAAERLDLPVVLAGPPNRRHRATVRAVEEAAAERSAVIWRKDLSRGQVLALFAAAACHVLPSWCEVVAQVDLEAITAGTRVVTTTRGHMHEYLGDDAVYWDPDDGPPALADAIAVALERPRPRPSPDRFPLHAAGEALLETYRAVVAGPTGVESRAG